MALLNVIQPQLLHYYAITTTTELCHELSRIFLITIFDNVSVTVQVSFTRNIRDTYFKNPLEGCFSNLNLIYIGKS